ncbi:hypothetical protein [Roseateles sp.]|uniref:hypothetical protein n=1 Tax=Roseateles sp. TaxID=1971397 RepID=UPI0039E95449
MHLVRTEVKMLLVQRMRISVLKRTGVVVFRSDLAPLGGPTQISEALRTLVDDGVLVRLGEGIYAKASRDEHGAPVPAATLQEVIREVLSKLDVKSADVCIEDQGTRKRVIVGAPNRKIDRHLLIGSCQVEIVTHGAMAKSFTLPQDPACFPRHNVAKYVEVLAKTHRISSKRTGLDRWAEAVSRAAGDTVQLDKVGQTLARLKQRQVINGRQMAHLMNNYMTEQEEAHSDV